MSVAILSGCAAPARPSADSPRPATVAVPAFAGSRSCDGKMAAQADTTVDSKDPLVRTLKPLGQGGPRYPVDMRESGVSGQVVVTFTVDTLGTVPPGGTMIQRESRTPFGDAVCAYFRRVRFDPLVVDGRRIVVRVVNTPFSFDIVR